MLVAAMVVLIAYGAIWLSVRDQHPYTGPSLGALGVLYMAIAAFGILVAVVTRRAISGVSGRSSQRRRGEAIAFAVAWTSVYVFQGALHHAGASRAIAYGIYPAAAPLIIVGSAAAAYEAAKENWDGRASPARPSPSPAPAPSRAPKPCGPSWASVSPPCCSPELPAGSGCTVERTGARPADPRAGAAAHRRHAGGPPGG
jgi:hypothetical protein